MIALVSLNSSPEARRQSSVWGFWQRGYFSERRWQVLAPRGGWLFDIGFARQHAFDSINTGSRNSSSGHCVPKVFHCKICCRSLAPASPFQKFSRARPPAATPSDPPPPTKGRKSRKAKKKVLKQLITSCSYYRAPNRWNQLPTYACTL